MREEALTDRSLNEVFAFMRRSNPFAQMTWGWDTGRFVDWRWGSNARRDAEHPGWFASHCRVFREGSEIRALLIAESSARDVCVITADEDPAAVETVLGRLVAERETGAVGVNLDILDTAQWLKPILVQFSLTEKRETGHEWEYELSRIVDDPLIRQGFTVQGLTDDRSKDYGGIAECIAAAFDATHDIRATLSSLEANPMFVPELSVFARSSEGRIAAYCRGTVDPDNGVCGIDPVCTHPDFQQLGLGKAVVMACFRAQRDLGGRFCYIGSAAEPAPGTFLYRSLGPSRKADYASWSKPPLVPGAR